MFKFPRYFTLLKLCLVTSVCAFFSYYSLLTIKHSSIQPLLSLPNSSLDCYEYKKSVLPDISTINSDPEKSIFFLEVSCSEKIEISARQACSVESAALTNPDYSIYLVYASSADVNYEGTLSDRLLKILLQYGNIKIMHMDYRSLVKNTPVEYLYKNRVIHNATYPVIVASDIARLLILQKYGGIYLDLDVLVLKPLDDLALDFAGLHYNTEVNNAIIKCVTEDICYYITELCLEEIKENDEWDKWQITGPSLFTKVLTNICNVKAAKDMINSDCEGFKIYSAETFYPVVWNDWSVYFNGQHSQELFYNILNNSYIIHVWNKLSRSTKASSVPHSIYNTLAKYYCPLVYKEAGVDF